MSDNMRVKNPIIWALVDHRPGTAAQALGVATELGLAFHEKELRYGSLAALPNILKGATLTGISDDSRARLTPPWPDLVITAGRRAAPVARWIKQQSGGVAKIAQIMNPGRAGASEFDLIAIPNHDCKVPGGDAANVVRFTGAPHLVNRDACRRASETWTSKLAHLPKPWVALLVGGATNKRPFPVALARELARRAVAGAGRGSVLCTTSRRTGAEASQILAKDIGDRGLVFQWGDAGENPYRAFLGLADAIIVTGDSVSMCSEACAMGTPVYIFAPDGMVSAKHARLHAELFALTLARPFADRVETWSHPPLNAAADIARAIEEIL